MITRHFVLVSDDDRCTLDISSGGSVTLRRLQWDQSKITEASHDDFSHGGHSIPLPSGVYHLTSVQEGLAWSIAHGKCTVVVVPSSRDPWPDPPAALGLDSASLLEALKVYLEPYLKGV